MTKGNLELAQIVASWVVTLPAVAGIIVRDQRRLQGEQLARAWPPQSRDAAIFGLWNLGVHPLCVLLHFARTRRGYAGMDMGLLGLAAVLVADYGAQLGVAVAVDWLGW